jgi:hypothetical protein
MSKKIVDNNYQEIFAPFGANAWLVPSGTGILVIDTDHIVSLVTLFGSFQLLFDS